MAISHTDHNHPNTPAARAKCRKEMASGKLTMGQVPADEIPIRHSVEEIDRIDKARRATWNVKPKGKQPAALKNTKRTGTLIKGLPDMADVPQALAHGIREAWARDLDVRVGDKFRDDEARVVIQADLCEIALVWKSTNVHGVHAIWVRNWDSSKAFKVNSVAEAFMVADTRELWDEYGNLRTA